MSETIYILSGLGADKSLFCNIDFNGHNVVHIDWIKPLRNEKIENYALRLSKVITQQNPIIIGLSFGGIIAIEISKIISTKKVILISSAKNKFEIPIYYKISGKLKLNNIIPITFLKNANALTYFFFGIKTKEEKKILKEILNNTDEQFLKWAINCIVNWKNYYFPQNIIHIHGTKDLILPIRKSSNIVPIKKGGHLMVWNKSSAVNNILQHHLKK